MGCTQRDYEIESEKIRERFEEWIKTYGNERIKISDVIKTIESWEEEQRKKAALYHAGLMKSQNFDFFNMLREDYEENLKYNYYIQFGPNKGERRIWPFMTPEERYREKIEQKKREEEFNKKIEEGKKQGKSGLELLF